jgi:hypothetical protein
MKTTTLLLFFIVLTKLALADSFENEALKAAFCKGRMDKKSIQQRFLDQKEKLAFKNQGGIGGMGVCWWHSRFQRNAFYLANYQPQKPKPSHKEAKKIIRAIRSGKKVVNITGFSNLEEFSSFYQNEIQAELENWQVIDGFLKQKWVQGLSGRPRSASDLKKNMDRLYQDVEKKGQMGYMKIQSEGIEAHALLVGSMKKTSFGYILNIIDSNFPGEVKMLDYIEGDDRLHPYANVYLEFSKEAEKLQDIVAKSCSNELIQNSSDCKVQKSQGFLKNFSSDVKKIISNGKNNNIQLGQNRSNSSSTDCSIRREGSGKESPKARSKKVHLSGGSRQ